MKDSGITFEINGSESYELPILGEHNMKNASIAIAVGKHLNLSYDQIYNINFKGNTTIFHFFNLAS